MRYQVLGVTLVVAMCGVAGPGCISNRLAQASRAGHEAPLPQNRSPLSYLPAKPVVTVDVVESNPLGAMLLPLGAMAAVESRNDPFAVGDGGRAIGLYQIHWSYWKDSRVPGKWEDCRDPVYSQRVVLAYWQRYCPDALRRGDLEVLCRVHNGGPLGHKKRHTESYWQKIQAVSMETALTRVALADVF